ncbi:PREDICTED: MD-2-related lipid-recognition protein-like, partial [Diuraphis noxia]|uniref:MD-2-related lipid-recognition protein-like n=1 Tax=Diuraphis noxia TaxID=143948 RepID=UPI00076383DF
FAASVVNAEEVTDFSMCRNARCEVYDLFIEPCPEALNHQPCEIPQNITASIKFKYVAGFDSKTPKTRLYAVTAGMDIPFKDMDPNACLYTNCPIMMNVEQDWLYNLYISTDYPKDSYTVKLKFWDDGPNANRKDVCCFKFDIKIV